MSISADVTGYPSIVNKRSSVVARLNEFLLAANFPSSWTRLTLSELEHLRRLSVMGPGGLTRGEQVFGA